jgi:uncharacterized protein with PhoU and TrkA domain
VSLKRLLKKPTQKRAEQRILEMLIQMKDTSELLINLAYTALLTNNKNIAQDIFELEDAFDKFHTEFELEVLRMKLSKGEEKRRLGLIRLGVASENLADAAAQIAEIVLRGVSVHPVMQIALKEADERVSREVVATNSELAHKRLSQLRLENHGARILAVKRKDRWIYDPEDQFKLQPGDIIYAGGYREGAERLEALARGDLRELD